MTQTATAFRVEAIPVATLDRIRAAGVDAFGNQLVSILDESGGKPLRCCLRPASPGESITLIAYRPFTRPGPYAEVGPVFIHAQPCPGYRDSDSYPPGYRDWDPMIFRPYRYDGTMAYPAITIAEAGQAGAVIVEIFTDPDIELIHTRNVYAGCYMFAIHRI